jgi:hypothetical protein
MRQRFLAFLFLIIACLTAPLRSDDSPNYIGKGPGDTLVFTSRNALEDFYRTDSIDPHRYRLGNDIVVFIGGRGLNPKCLYMCPAEEFTKAELKSFLPSTQRKDLPPRNHPMFDRLQVTGRRAGFH